MANKKALGRGLRALLPDAPASPGEEQRAMSGAIDFIPVNRITPNPFQPREVFDPEHLAELRRSIAEKGIVQPITVRRHDDGYQLIAGERRLRAVRDLEIQEIPAYILEIDSDEEMLELAIIENIHREDLNPVDIARGYRRLIDECRLTQEQVADKVGKDRTTVTNFLRLLKLPRRIQSSLQADELSMGHARALLSLPTSEEQIALWQKIVRQKLSVRQVEDLARNAQRKSEKQKKPVVVDRRSLYIEDVENRLRTHLTTKVHIKSRPKGGAIEIEYFSDDELERLVSMICGDESI
ncbi:ParB/RepB/Spo0J family partition protein [candidate division KSB1 bacterium]|nr:ParB/RepB/Spo0J family partition protein [candidate division KSB1 bacterium]